MAFRLLAATPAEAATRVARFQHLAASKLGVDGVEDDDVWAPVRVKFREGFARHTFPAAPTTQCAIVLCDPDFKSVRVGFCNLEPPKSPFRLASDLSSHAYPR